ncbi:hypothetical protein EW026_g2206 [Hermanssonia centrifuga]|uniref:Uncharacterized protein n=1 Tax=Hermanssonia centrifuga TaxID=98765 RepID=A0A4S4KPY0_9APHY|nr:hypothetical protein EW026_g2206 [Hermanssonia centrifuga]
MIASDRRYIHISTVKGLADDLLEGLDALASNGGMARYGPSSLSPCDPVTLASLDETLALALSQVRMMRNTRSPINALPPEVLTTIFEMLAGPRALPSTDSRDNSSTTGNPMEWIPVTHVCRYWRDTALGYPFMWNPIVFKPSDMRSECNLPYECLQRSVGAPLDVQVKCDPGGTRTHVWEKLSARCGRIRKCHLMDLTDLENLSYFNQEAPLLESLCIQISPEVVDERELTGDSTMPSELPLLFAGHTPSLRFLTLNYFDTFSTNQFVGLTHLHLSDIYTPSGDVAHIIALLELNPGLEEFTLTSGDISDLDVDSLPTLPIGEDTLIPMPMLRRLSLVHCHASIIQQLVSRLVLSNPHLAMKCHTWWPSEWSIATIVPPKTAARIHPLQDVVKLQIAYDTAEVYTVSRSSAAHFRFENDIDTADDIVPSLRTLLSFHGLQELWLSGIELHSAEFWQNVFGAVVGVKKMVLGLSPTAPENWLLALTPTELHGKPYPAPSLEELHIYPPYPQCHEALVNLVENRANDGHRLRLLCIMCKQDAYDSRLLGAYDAWKSSMAEFVDNIVLVTFSCPPIVGIPEECRPFI